MKPYVYATQTNIELKYHKSINANENKCPPKKKKLTLQFSEK